jgi:2-phosphosulfolactate phosphatase
MRIDVVSCVNEAHAEDFVNKTVLVIDVLRSTTNMAVAMANGCRSIVPADTIHTAKRWQVPGDLMGGERNCRKIPGFDLGNSPFEYDPSTVGGKRIILTTTNGTRALQKVGRAQHIMAASLLNGPACCKAAVGFRRDVVILCAGTRDEFSLEDGLCAGKLVAQLKSALGCTSEVNDFGVAMEGYAAAVKDIPEAILSCKNGVRLSKMGFQEDVLFCSQWDTLDVVPVQYDGELVPLVPSVV